ncbi:MAG: thiamine diphosphokinase, partial [Bacteroidales bacterium]|nr:thiamine diphosphokinase [Bacteroidales bacterium]
KTVILANGTYPSHKVPLKHLREAELVVCCDGAAEKLVAHGLEPGIIIGDLDSVSPALKKRYEKILVADADQESNDLTKAVNWCVEQGIEEVVILGATGIREDHTLGNISLLSGYCERIDALMLTNTGTFRVYDRSVTIGSHPGQQVSIFSIDPTLTVTSSGLRYPLNNLTLNSWWRGTLNEAADREFRLEFVNGRVIVFMEYHVNLADTVQKNISL